MASDIKTIVSERYGEIARSGISSADVRARSIAEAFGYSEAELESIPAEANMGLSCGNPTAMASLREGETVVDLGSGGGLDVFLAAHRVGSTGKAIGIDMTQDMIELAQKNAQKMGLDNVAFHLAEIESMPLEDDSVGCVISNCVLNLVPDKLQAFKEIFRILRPGGRLAVSDIALKQPLPPDLAQSVAAYTGCIAGALLIDEYERLLREAGFTSVRIIDTEADLDVYQSSLAPDAADSEAVTILCCSTADVSADTDDSCCGEASSGTGPVSTSAALRLQGIDVNAFAASVKVFALK